MLRIIWFKHRTPGPFFTCPPWIVVSLVSDRRVNSDGLMEKAGFWDFCDWVPEWDKDRGTPSPWQPAPPPFTTLPYALALQTAAQLVKAAGRAALAADTQSAGCCSCCAVKKALLEHGKGPPLRRSAGLSSTASTHRRFAVLTGLIQGPAAAELMDRALSAEGIWPAPSMRWHFYLPRIGRRTLRALCFYLGPPIIEIPSPSHHPMPETPGTRRSDATPGARCRCLNMSA